MIALASAVLAQSVTVRVVDQNGVEIPGSQVLIDGSPGAGSGTIIATGQTIPLSTGSHTFDIYPGIEGLPQLGGLFRRELATLAAGQTDLTFEWITTDVTIHLRDQNGVTIPGSRVTVDPVPGLGYQPVPYQITLPITDLATYPTLGGPDAEGGNKGYDIQLVPGIEGQWPGPTFLIRIPGSQGSPEVVTVHADTTELDFRWTTTQVTLDIKDQFGVHIPGSKILLYATGNLGHRDLPLTTTLPITDLAVYPDLTGSESESPSGGHGYGMDLLPGILGELFQGHLQREEGVHASQAVRVHADTSVIDFEWITTTLTVDLRDQNGISIPGSEVFLYAAPSSGYHATPFTVTLPISDSGVYPTMILVGAAEGPGQHGYDLLLVPGVEGQSQRFWAGSPLFLYRTAGLEGSQHLRDDSIQVHSGQTELNLQWITASLVVDLQDQLGASIPGSQILMANMPALGRRSAPFQITLPISDPAVYPSLDGSAAEGSSRGYDVLLHPGLDGQPQHPCCGDLLVRYPGTQTNPTSEPVEVHAGQTTLVWQWTMVTCPVLVADAGGTPLIGSTIHFPYVIPSYTPGATLRLPITDNSVYPDIFGAYANGYAMLVTPSDIAPLNGAFEFELTPSGAFHPPSFTIGGRAYSLTCSYNRPPTADAGPNVTILSSQQAAMILAGTAQDPDGNTLTYRWLEGASELLASTAVAANGAAPLALSTLPPLALGDHALTLEVTDGEYTATSRMTLTVGNAPPSVQCAGSGTFQAGQDPVVLDATVADYDGDGLAWTWTRNGTVIASGFVSTSSGGNAVTLPTTILTTGAMGTLPVGTHTLVLTVSDGVNAAVTCQVQAIVIDTLAPTLAPVADCGILWPPNHQLVTVTIDARATDSSGGPVVLGASATSSEDPDKAGDGSTIPDIVGPSIDQAAGTVVYQLRAERSGKGPGRTYTIVITATDAAGNQATATVTCLAPHDRR